MSDAAIGYLKSKANADLSAAVMHYVLDLLVTDACVLLRNSDNENGAEAVMQMLPLDKELIVTIKVIDKKD